MKALLGINHTSKAERLVHIYTLEVSDTMFYNEVCFKSE